MWTFVIPGRRAPARGAGRLTSPLTPLRCSDPFALSQSPAGFWSTWRSTFRGFYTRWLCRSVIPGRRAPARGVPESRRSGKCPGRVSIQTASGSIPLHTWSGRGYSRKGLIPGPLSLTRLPRNDSLGRGVGREEPRRGDRTGDLGYVAHKGLRYWIWYWFEGFRSHPTASLRSSAGAPVTSHPRYRSGALKGLDSEHTSSRTSPSPRGDIDPGSITRQELDSGAPTPE